ncbi:anti-sigma factor [Burkholderia sp. L27(2015)]|uniref:anti-sigma factor family protein n=1 Tax=Burkholderia sp. L27(2015) TaxID=1641858 RepID=UPI00131B52D0|nr:anti-sigma factor [Burkholderia sp. L27(2015)]
MNIDDILLMSYVDDDVSPEQRAEVEAAIAASPEVGARVAALRASRLPYQAAFARQAIPPVPESLTRRLDELLRQPVRAPSPPVGAPRVPSTRQHSTLAWLAVAFVAGAFFCGAALRFAPEFMPGFVSEAVPVKPAQPLPWIQAVVGYQDMYTRDTLANVSDDPKLTAETVSQIHRDDALAVEVPDLRETGLSFKQLQRLRFRNRPVVQIVYLPEHGNPVALCVIGDSRPDQAVQTQQVGSMNVVTWRRGKLSYALLSKDAGIDLQAVGAHLANGATPALFGQLGTQLPPLPMS